MCFFILYTSKYINLLYECHFFRKAKENATRLLAAASYVAMTPQRAHVGLCNDNPWTPSDHLLDLDDTIAEDDHLPVQILDDCLGRLSDAIGKPRIEPLRAQLCSLDECTNIEKSNVIKKTEQACQLICEAIAPNDSDQLFQEVVKRYKEEDVTLDVGIQALLAAYQSASSKCLKTQILSIYAKEYTSKELKAMHKSFEILSDRRIKKARALSTAEHPGAIIEKKTQHRVRMDKTKLDHFIEFTSRPYYYQDVAFGSRTIKLESGEELVMPNVVRTVARCTIINQYLEYCAETSFQPFSRSSMWRVLEVQEASQRKSLRGLDNTAAEGGDAFDTLHKIVDELEEIGAKKGWSKETQKNLRQGKLYLKTTYRDHCQGDGSTCPDHCKPFALSDPHDPDYKTKCKHNHDVQCVDCEKLKDTLHDVEAAIPTYASLIGKDRQEDMQYDAKIAVAKISQWKAHVLRAQNQDQAKQHNLSTLKQDEALIIIDWAMKFTAVLYREKQSEWFGKRGINWHVSSVVTRSTSTDDLEVISYLHLLNSCRQDWFAVLSIIEHLFSLIKKRNSSISKAYIRSDEAGCYHNNMLVSSLCNLGERQGIQVMRYDHSEPQSGKDICDRILCPLKASIRRYCNEGNDIATAQDMYTALKERPVNGTTATVCTIAEENNTLEIDPINNYSKLHNFEFTTNGLRVWKAFNIGPGKLLPVESIVTHPQGATELKEEVESFPTNARKLESKKKDEVSVEKTYECPDPSCSEEFAKHSELELHLNVYGHRTNSQAVKISLYEQLKKDWVHRFETLSLQDERTSNPCQAENTDKTTHPPLSMGWALHTRSSSKRFSTKVREYLTMKFNIGQETGRKEDPAQVAKDMRTASTLEGERMFNRTEWLTKSQIQGFFSRLSKKIKEGQVVTTTEDVESESEDDEDVVEEYVCQEDEGFLIDTRQAILDKMGVSHPITYDAYNLCRMTRDKNISSFIVNMLKELCNHFELPFKSRDIKANLVAKIEEMVQECSCSTANTP